MRGLPHKAILSSAEAAERAALRYLARRDRTQAQLREYLLRMGLSQIGVRHLVARLVRQGYLNDEAYANRWAETRLARRPMGRDRLEAELLAQGLDARLVARTLALVYKDRSERDLAQALLARYAKAGQEGNPRRLDALLKRHGFSEDLIQDILGFEGVKLP